MDKLNRYIIGSNASIFQKIDPSSNIEVFLPTNEEEIKEAIAFAREKDLPITSKGGGSSLSGACTGGSRNKVVISSMKLKRVHELNFNDNYAIVDPGLTPDELNAYIQKEKANWKFFVAPSSKDIASLGGMLSTDGGGNDAWLAGTMADNVLAVELFDYNSNKITIERVKDGKSKKKSIITCADKKLEKKLQEKNLSIFDISNSHGVLGFIAKLKVAIKPLPQKGNLRYALAHSKSYNSFGRIIYELIENNLPLSYGEAIVEVKDPEISDQTHPPMFIFEYPEKYNDNMQTICKQKIDVDFTPVTFEEFSKKKNIRTNIAKRNPPGGYQIALFEDYGIYGQNLLKYEEIMERINRSLMKYHFEPFIKFGHAPSVWHDNQLKIKGIIMHSREKRPENLNQDMLYKALLSQVELCEELGITPKPEHKWPYFKNTRNYKRLVELTSILGRKFNPFIMDCNLEELVSLFI